MKFAKRINEERGISAVIVAVSLIALFGAAVLTIDAGSAWATRRKIVTGTDSGVLGAARLFANGLADPCTALGRQAGEQEASTILAANAPEAEHNATSTPNGYEVTVSGCGTANGSVGHVRFDGRLASQQAFSGVFGFTKTRPFSSSTAQFGYITAITGGLRPFTVCDQHSNWSTNSAPPNPLPPATGAGPFPHFALWNWLQKGQITQAQYDAYFGQNPNEYPLYASQGINAGQGNYLSPAQGGGVVHKVNLKDDCGGGSSWRGWMDYDGGSNPTGDLIDWLENGYPGTVSLTPHDCGSGNANGNCDGYPGNHNGLRPALDTITCPRATPSKDCFYFPVVLNEGVTGNGNNTEVDHNAFLFVILRGWASDDQNNPCKGNNSCLLDLEFVRVQTEGAIGGNPNPGAGITTPRGTSLCGIDHDSQTHRCNV
jgi:hypothetical protein